MFPSHRCNTVTRLIGFYGLLLSFFLQSEYSYAQPPVAPPRKILVSLGYSTLDVRPPDWKWLQAQCASGSILNTLKPVSDKVSGILVPVFDDGRCFYSTSVDPFQGRNPDGDIQEKALRELLSTARQANIPVYLGVDVIGWQKGVEKSKLDIFSELPQLQEITKDSEQPSKSEVKYASPFNNKVRSVMISVVQELSAKFPEASGIALDLRLSDQEMLGYSDAARESSIIDISIDPIDLAILGRIGEPERFGEWIDWRRSILNAFLNSLIVSYKGGKNKQVLISGYADYYDQTDFSNLRASQDWFAWLGVGSVNGVLLEGRWLSHFTDNGRVGGYLKQVDELANKVGNPILLTLVANGNHLVKNSDYQRDWTAIKSRNNDINRVMLVARSDEDLGRVIALASGIVSLTTPNMPKVSEMVPEWGFNDAGGKWQSAKNFRGQNSVIMLVGHASAKFSRAVQALLASATQLRLHKIEPIVVSEKPVLGGERANIVNIIDAGRELSWFGATPTLVVVDKAGFIRGVETVRTRDSATMTLRRLTDLTPKIQIGSLAPDFSVDDMNGRSIHLRDFKGKKNVLLTFFPKCFTGGCQNHLSSLRDHKADFDASDTAVLAVSIDPADVQIAFAAQWSLPFPLIPDTGRNLSILYGAAVNTEQLADRQSVLIDKTGIVRLIDRKVNVSTHGHDIVEKMRELGLVK